MNRQHPALRVALLGVAAALVGFVVIALLLGWQAHAYGVARDSAVAVAPGTVVEDGLGDSGDIRVRWADRSGREHLQRFPIYNVERYTKGRAFAVAYDPAKPAVHGFPSDPEEVSAQDDLVVPIGIAGLIAAALLLTWGLRGVLFSRAGARPGQPMVAVALTGQLTDSGPVSLGNSSWFTLANPTAPHQAFRWQRVMWHPAIDSTDSPVDVVVHGDMQSRRRVVLELPDGIRLVPIGRLRRRSPRGIFLEKRSDVRTDLTDSFILPTGTPPPPSQRWWHGALVLALVGAGVGAMMGFFIGGGGIAVFPFAAGASALLVNGWALTGTDP
jgi:hypothetical protein